MAKIIKTNRTGNIFADEYLIIRTKQRDSKNNEGLTERVNVVSKRFKDIRGLYCFVNSNEQLKQGKQDIPELVIQDLERYELYMQERKRIIEMTSRKVDFPRLDRLKREIGVYKI